MEQTGPIFGSVFRGGSCLCNAGGPIVKIVSLVARYLLGLLFTIFGLNGLLESVQRGFIHNPPPTNPLALEFIHTTGLSHFAVGFFSLQLLGGLLLLSGFFVPLALTLPAAELFNILAFHLSFAPAAIGPGVVACLLWLLVFLTTGEISPTF